MRASWVVGLVALLGGSGCSSGPLMCEIRAQRMSTDRKAVVDLAPGDTLVSGDSFSFTVRVSEPAYVYAVQFHERSGGRLVYPPPSWPTQDKKVAATSDVRIPEEADAWFILDDEPGQEHIYLLFARTTLGQADQQLAKALEEVRLSPRAAESSGDPAHETWPLPAPLEPSPRAVDIPGHPSAAAPGPARPPFTPPREKPKSKQGSADGRPLSPYDEFNAKGAELVRIDDGGRGYSRCVDRGGLAVMKFLVRHEHRPQK